MNLIINSIKFKNSNNIDSNEEDDNNEEGSVEDSFLNENIKIKDISLFNISYDVYRDNNRKNSKYYDITNRDCDKISNFEILNK